LKINEENKNTPYKRRIVRSMEISWSKCPWEVSLFMKKLRQKRDQIQFADQQSASGFTLRLGSSGGRRKENSLHAQCHFEKITIA